MPTASRRILASASENQGLEKGDLIPLGHPSFFDKQSGSAL